MNSKNTLTDYYSILQIDLIRKDKYIDLSHLSICYTWGKKSHIRTINLKYQLQLKNKIADKITRVSKMWLKNNSETNKEEILRKIFIPPELR